MAGMTSDAGGHIVQASSAQRVAAQQPPCSQRCAAQGAVGGDGGRGVLRTGGNVAAPAAGVQRMQRRGEPAAVEDESSEQEARHSAVAGAEG